MTEEKTPRGVALTHPETGKLIGRGVLACEMYAKGDMTRYQVLEKINELQHEQGIEKDWTYTALYGALASRSLLEWNQADKERLARGDTQFRGPKGIQLPHPETGEMINRSKLACEMYAKGDMTRQQVLDKINEIQYSVGIEKEWNYPSLRIALMGRGQVEWNKADLERLASGKSTTGRKLRMMKHPETGKEISCNEYACELYAKGDKSRADVLELVNKVRREQGITPKWSSSSLRAALTRGGLGEQNQADKDRRFNKMLKNSKENKERRQEQIRAKENPAQEKDEQYEQMKSKAGDKPAIIDFEYYGSLEQVAKKYDITVDEVNRRCSSNEFPDWNLV